MRHLPLYTHFVRTFFPSAVVLRSGTLSAIFLAYAYRASRTSRLSLPTVSARHRLRVGNFTAPLLSTNPNAPHGYFFCFIPTVRPNVSCAGATTGLYTMTLLNVHPASGIMYSNMRHLSTTYPTAWDAERLNAQIFYDMERLALPFYRAVASLPDHLDDPAPLLQEAIASIRAAFRLFADIVKEGKVKKDVWMSHAQGFHAWGADGFDGVSGDHSVLIRTLDAFLGIPTRTRVEVEPTWFGKIWRWWKGGEHEFTEVPYSNDYLPARQVAWIAAVRQEKLRDKLGERPEVADMVRQLRLWRLGHTRKAVYYEDLELPERKPMTASGGVGGGVAVNGEGGVWEMIRRLEMSLRARVEATR